MSESFMHMQEYRKAISALEKALPLIKDSGDEVAEVLVSLVFCPLLFSSLQLVGKSVLNLRKSGQSNMLDSHVRLHIGGNVRTAGKRILLSSQAR